MERGDHPHREFWNSRYASGKTPWDFGGVPADLKAYLTAHPKGGKVLVPGCGAGYEVAAFAEAGYEVTAIDLAPAAVELARKRLGPQLADRVILGDFFTHSFGAQQFDLIYERTFICSLWPDQRTDYRDRVASLLRHRGLLIGYFYYQTPVLEEGPPFGFAWGTADELFAQYFLLMKDRPVNDSLTLFKGRERWQERSRTAVPAPAVAA
ncbi:MAG TPA: methyltransferase domain-containing protein [Opitutaceae bacterium]|nr:methyltransferase domain-containing protein [Opitutaceae bacterium]